MTTAGAPLVLLTGASGYVGGRLLPALAAEGYRVRCLARRPEYLAPRLPAGAEVAAGDVRDPVALGAAMHGVGTAFYLVHSMGSGDAFEEDDRRAARTFAGAAREAGVGRIVYLGGLGSGNDLSPHLRSRQEVGHILRDSGVPVIELRASIIIGSGSLSFEMVRSLVERLPVLIVPRWTRLLAQPIGIEDVVAYLLAATLLPLRTSRVCEIGGPDRISYLGLMEEYARVRGLKRLMIPVPVLTPYLSSLWLGLVTPLYARVGRKLVTSLRCETVVRDDAALRDFPVRPRGVRDAILRALRNEDREFAATRWSDALSSLREPAPYGGLRAGSRIVDSRSVTVPVAPAQAFEPVRRIGGRTGWYAAGWLWRLRGFLDRLVGGPGLRRGRRDPANPLPGDTVDFWRVEAYEPDRRLLLFAEMKLPGRAWLQFEVDADGAGSAIRQTALFEPAGFPGVLYWYALYPIHGIVFARMLRGIARAATRGARS